MLCFASKLIYENDVALNGEDTLVSLSVQVQIYFCTSLVLLLCVFMCQETVLAHSSLFLPDIDNANLLFSSLISSSPFLRARSTVAVKSTQWAFVQCAQRSVCSC